MVSAQLYAQVVSMNIEIILELKPSAPHTVQCAKGLVMLTVQTVKERGYCNIYIMPI